MTDTTLGLAFMGGRCAHGFHSTQHPTLCDCLAQQAKAHALAAVNDAADPDFAARIDAAIRSAAALGEPFSANSIRHALADVPGPLIGARFNAAARAGLIEHVGYVASTKSNTHAHGIKLWKGRRS